MGEIRDLLHLDCATVNGKTLEENPASARIRNPEVIRVAILCSAAAGLRFFTGAWLRMVRL